MSGHQGHICFMAGRGPFGEIRQPTRGTRLICFTCGRVADSQKNPCNPMPDK